MSDKASQLRRQILDLAAQHFSETSRSAEFIPGVTPVPVSGKVIDGADISAVVDSALDAWFTTGRFADLFRTKSGSFRWGTFRVAGELGFLSESSGIKRSHIAETRRSAAGAGDEVITVAAGFPTTVNPIFQNRLVPVFVDVTVPTYEIDTSQLEAARSERTKAVFLAHTLGNTFDLDAVCAIYPQVTICG